MIENDIIEYEFTDVLDLHCFSPKDIKILLNDYISYAHEKGWDTVRIIHGKGKGMLRDLTLSVLKKNPLVMDLKVAPEDAGGWGAVLVSIKIKRDSNEKLQKDQVNICG